jgi:hypothetical protein
MGRHAHRWSATPLLVALWLSVAAVSTSVAEAVHFDLDAPARGIR